MSDDGFYFRLVCASPDFVRVAWCSAEFEEAVDHLAGYARLGWRESIFLRLSPADGDVRLALSRLELSGLFLKIAPIPGAIFYQVNSRGDLP